MYKCMCIYIYIYIGSGSKDSKNGAVPNSMVVGASNPLIFGSSDP